MEGKSKRKKNGRSKSSSKPKFQWRKFDEKDAAAKGQCIVCLTDKKRNRE